MYKEVVPAGVYVGVDSAVLMHEVIVSPFAEEWFVQLVQSMMSKYDLEAPVRQSELLSEPYWGEE